MSKAEAFNLRGQCNPHMGLLADNQTRLGLCTDTRVAPSCSL